MKNKKSSKNSDYEDSDNCYSGISLNEETTAEKNPEKKFNITKINELEKQLKLLKE